MIKVLLVDDHQIIIDGLKTYFEKVSDMEVVGTATNGSDALLMLKKQIDVVVLDIEMPIMNGIETAIFIRKHYPSTKILILSMYKRKSVILKLMEIGISGYILKEKSIKEVVHAIRNINEGNSYFGLEILNTIAASSPDSSIPTPLTDREEEILRLIGLGFTSKEIADELWIAYNTVVVHRNSLLKKLSLSNDKHLVRYAIKHGYVEV